MTDMRRDYQNVVVHSLLYCKHQHMKKPEHLAQHEMYRDAWPSGGRALLKL